ncbi:MAG TPA: DUF177 domain-containing protein [Ignavibacteria bacterium]|nr:DUF177 domain-containing protein [Ignavibacteria bacterium]
MLKIHISNLAEGEHDYQFKFNKKEFKDLEIDDLEIEDDLLLNVKLLKYGNQFDLKCQLKGNLRLLCDRCLEDYIYDFENSFEVIYKFDFTIKKEESVTDSDDIKLIPPKTGFIDIKEDVRDFILLSVPMKRVPEENNDICTYCNKSISGILNISSAEEINPVWEKLVKTTKQKNK